MMMTMNTIQEEIVEGLTVAQEDNMEEVIEMSLLEGVLRETTGEIKMSGSQLLRSMIHY